MTDREIFDLSAKYLNFMTEVRRDIHKKPGTGLDNIPTVEYIGSVLTSLGIQWEMCGKCGISAILGKGDRCILLRADTDGLPVKEESGFEFASVNGNMHGCGHDLHAAMLLGCAKILSENSESLCGTVKLMFQSGEETLEGAKDMIDSGILKNPDADAAIMLHVMTAVGISTGNIIIPKCGVSAPSADYFEIEIIGKGCHGSSPFQGLDPIYAASNIVTALSVIDSRELSPNEYSQLAICSFNSGNAGNVIPDKANLRGSLRTFDEDVRNKVKLRIEDICKGICDAFRTKCNVKFTSGCPALINDKEMCDMAKNALPGLFQQGFVLSAEDFETKNGVLGSEDFSYISREVPSLMLALAAGPVEEGYEYPLHHPKVKFDERAMIYGCAALCKIALYFLENKKRKS